MNDKITSIDVSSKPLKIFINDTLHLYISSSKTISNIRGYIKNIFIESADDCIFKDNYFIEIKQNGKTIKLSYIQKEMWEEILNILNNYV